MLDMQPKAVKLARFKSFVDPTTLELRSSLVSIVGLNGCGKSNVIDAVRWVMGESSAKNLRGEYMADVIFNGSLDRKPVGQASIELFFFLIIVIATLPENLQIIPKYRSVALPIAMVIQIIT